MSGPLNQSELDAAQVVAANILKGGACDFCSRSFDGYEVLWRTPSRISMTIRLENDDGSKSEEVSRDYGTGWAACAECDEMLAKGDATLLVEHVMPFMRTGDEAFDAENRRSLLTLYAALFDDGIAREVVMPRLSPRVASAAEARARARVCVEEAQGLNQARAVSGLVMDAREDFRVLRRITMLLTEAERLDSEWGLRLFDHDDHATMRGMRRELQAATEKLTADERAARLAERRAGRQDTHPISGRLCSECGKRDARVDDLCKRCAHAAGLIPKGKIT